MDILKVANNFRWDRCPLCGSGDIALKGRLKYQGRLNYSTVEIELDHVPELWECRHCDSGFVQNIVTAETARMLYSTGQAGQRWSTAPFEQNKTREVTRHMRAIFADKGDVLDVGCNTGELLDLARESGCRTAGVEYSSASREVLAGKGHDAYATLDDARGKYDVITAFDLVEHLYDVPAFLQSCRERLAEDGRLVILTGDIDSMSARLSGARWWYVQYPEHIVFPSKRYFREHSGFNIENRTRTYASVNYLFPLRRRLAEILNVLLRRKAFIGLPSIGPDHILITLTR